MTRNGDSCVKGNLNKEKNGNCDMHLLKNIMIRVSQEEANNFS